MSESSKSGLVVRPAGVLEKTTLGANRVLSSMIADTLALVNSHSQHAPRIVMLHKTSIVRSLFRAILKPLRPLDIIEFEDGDAAWQELSREDPDLLITDIVHSGMIGLEMLQLLADRDVEFPIIVLCEDLIWLDGKIKDWQHGRGLDDWLPELNISYRESPVNADHFLHTVKDRLGLIPLSDHNPRIAILHSEFAIGVLFRRSLSLLSTFVDIIRFVDGGAAWQHLSREDPDLLVVELLGPEGRGLAILRRLAEKGVNYRIIVISRASLDDIDIVIQETQPGIGGWAGWVSGLNIAYFEKTKLDDNFLDEDILNEVKSALPIPTSLQP